MARTKTMIRMVATLSRAQEGAPLEPDRIVKKVNEELCLDNREGMFVTVFFGILDPATAVVSFYNAGHNPPYIVSATNGVAVLGGPRNKPLGIRSTFDYASGTRTLDPGDCLFLFTDGITEAMEPAGDWFSEHRLEQTLRSLAGESASAVVAKVIARVREFAGTAPQADDIAAMAIRRT
jgi:sigma-B regulation protein RsbU (phosphoserine phosphatase)